MKRKKRTVLLLALAAAVIMCGCGKKQGENIVLEDEQNSGKEEEKTVTFFGYKADALNLTAIEAALHGFMNENPGITVIYEGMKGSQYWGVFEKKRTSGHLDDIVMLDHDRVLELCEEDMLADLSGLGTIDNFSSLAKSQFINEDGSVYFLPTCISAYGLYINEDLLKEHGQEIPTSLPEFMEVCDYFVEQGITPVIANNYSSLRCLMVAKGMYPVYQKEKPEEEIRKFNNGEADLAKTLRPGVEMVHEMIERGYFDCKEVLETSQTSGDLTIFAQGERPFMITGGWASPRVAAMNPDFAYRVYPMPVLEDDSVLVINVDTCVGITAQSGNLEEAMALIEYITDKDVMWSYCDSQSSYTPLIDDRIPSDSTVEPSVEYLINGQSVIGSDYNLELPLDAALMECGTGMLKGMNVDEAIELFSELLYS